MFKVKSLIVTILALATFLSPNVVKKSQAKEVTNIVFFHRTGATFAMVCSAG